MGHRGAVIWFTGLSGAGKTTIARALDRRLHAAGKHGFMLDGDVLRSGLTRDLGFSPADREQNNHRFAEVARLFAEAGMFALVSAISPYREVRKRARVRIGAERFVLVHVATPLSVCESLVCGSARRALVAPILELVRDKSDRRATAYASINMNNDSQLRDHRGRPDLMAAFVGTLVLAGCSEVPPATGTQSTHSVYSDAVGDEYLLRVRLPPGYDDDTSASYPLVVQLDPTFVGLQQYDITVGLISQRADAGDWPEAIVVGVDYDGPSQRTRDYLPPEPLDPQFGGDGADRFYVALRDELLPYLEERYRIDSSARTIVGHSNGGVFVWYSIFRHDPQQGEPLFSGAIALDNGYGQELFTLERWHSERSDVLPMRVYTARALYNGAVQGVTFDAMIERVDERQYEGLQLITNEFETDHGGVIRPGYEDGLGVILGGER